MSAKALRKLVEQSAEWAKAYCSVTAALMKQGVPENEARMAAMMAATSAMNAKDDDIIPGDEWTRGPEP